MRNLMRRSSGTSGSRSIIPRCTSAAQRTASTTLGKFRQQAVAGVLDDAALVLLDLRIDQLAARCALRRSCVPSSSAPIRRE